MTLDLDALRGQTLTQLGSVMCGAALGNDNGKAIAVSEELARRDAAVAELVAAIQNLSLLYKAGIDISTDIAEIKNLATALRQPVATGAAP